MWSLSQLPTATAIFLALSTLTADCALLQSCQSAGNCVFEVRDVSDRVYLDCDEEQQLCRCSPFPYIADVPAWELESGAGGECRIAETGPCGKDRNMVLDCMAGLECVQGRCRRLSKVGTAKEGELCEETVDCRQGLKCSVTGFYYQSIRRCTNMTYVDNYGPEIHPASSKEEQEPSTTQKPHQQHHHHHKHDQNRHTQESHEVPGGKVPSTPDSMEHRQHEQDQRSTTGESGSAGSTATPPPLVAPTAKATGENNGNGGESSLRGGCRLMALVSAVAVVVLGSNSC